MTPSAPEGQALRDALEPTEAEIGEMRAEVEDFRLPAPPPIPVRASYYLTECEHCGWIGSSEQCGTGGCAGYAADDIICPVCCSSMAGDGPSEADTVAHGEAVYQRIVTAEAERDALAKEAGEAMWLQVEPTEAACGWMDLHATADTRTREAEASLAALYRDVSIALHGPEADETAPSPQDLVRYALESRERGDEAEARAERDREAGRHLLKEMSLLIRELDPKNPDWGFRRVVMLETLRDFRVAVLEQSETTP